MSLLHKTVTRRARDARRMNARKSTGPRTAAGKRRSAASGRPPERLTPVATPLDSMLALAEDPGEYRQLLAELIAAHRPVNPAQRLLVEDIAVLRWRRLRNLRAQEGLTLKNLERLERDRLQKESDLEKDCSDFSQRKELEMGMFNIPDSPAKFKELGRLVDLFIDAVERRDFTEEGYRLMTSVYGPEPSVRGARIITAYHYLADLVRDAASAGGPLEQAWAGAENGGDVGGSEVSPPSENGQASVAEQFYRDLRIDLLEERQDICDKYLTYLQNHVPSVTIVRSDALTPSAPEWRMLMRQEQALDREIERKTKLLLYMKWAQHRRSRKGDVPNTVQNREAA